MCQDGLFLQQIRRYDGRTTEPYSLATTDTLFDDLIKAFESPTTDKEDIGRVDLDEILVWMLAPPLRRNVGYRPLNDFE